MIVGSFLKWGGDSSGLSTNALGLMGIFALIFGVAILSIGLSRSFVPQTKLPDAIAGLDIRKVGIILAAAILLPTFGMITAEGVKEGAVVIDVGINRVDEKLVGDVDFESVAEVAGAITPVPGGVGPMTIASLLLNTVGLAEARAEATG